MKKSGGRKGTIGTLFSPAMIVCSAAFLVIIFGIVAGPFIDHYKPDSINLLAMLQPPSIHHLLGTDNVGRDQFTRLLYGGRTTLLNALLAVLISVVVGIPIGLLCGYYGGVADKIVMRLWDCILSFPALLMAFILVAALGRSSYNATIAIGIVYVPMISKLARSMTLTEKKKPYVEACRTFGYSGFRIIFMQILPNCVTTLLAELTLDIGTAVLSLASLSFLGLGVQLPKSDWGAMLQEAMVIILKAPFLIVGPTVAIVLTSVSLNVISDSIQMYMDPDQRKLPSFRKYRKAMLKGKCES